MHIVNLSNKYYKKCLALSGSIEAWHCGRELSGNSFSLDFLGSGEGMLYLGPGIYFTDNRDLALRYAKYHDKAFLYKVSIPLDQVYDPGRGEPLNLREKSIELQKQLRIDLGLPENKHLSPTDSFKYGKEIVGFLVQKFGRSKAVQMLKDIGINGIYEHLPSGALEICIFDPSVISILDKEPL